MRLQSSFLKDARNGLAICARQRYPETLTFLGMPATVWLQMVFQRGAEKMSPQGPRKAQKIGRKALRKDT